MSAPVHDPPRRRPTHDESAADAVDAAADAAVNEQPSAPTHAIRAFWLVLHYAIARPLAMAVPVPRMFRFYVWTSQMSRR